VGRLQRQAQIPRHPRQGPQLPRFPGTSLILPPRLASNNSGDLTPAFGLQGDVESIASKNPKELTALLEQIAASDELKREYEDLETQKNTAEEKSALVYQEKRTIVMERKQKKTQKEEAEKHLRLQQDLVHFSHILLLF
jgi:chromosome segregation ATPase